MTDIVTLDRGDLKEFRDILNHLLHKSMAEDLLEQYRQLGRPKNSPLTKSVENLVARMDVYLTKEEEEPNA